MRAYDGHIALRPYEPQNPEHVGWGTSLGDLLVQLCLCAEDRERVRMTLGSRECLAFV